MLQEEIKKYIKVTNNNDIINYLLKYVNKTLDILYVNENYLFENNSSERNMVFHFARYFTVLLNNTYLKDYNVDCEYNKNKLGYKEIMYNFDNKQHKIYPDLILHERGSNKNNILAIEFKKFNNYNKLSKEKDYYKLKALTNNHGEFKYKLGLFIILGKKRELVKIIYFVNGNKYISSN